MKKVNLVHVDGHQLLAVDYNDEAVSGGVIFWAWAATAAGPAWLDFGSGIDAARKMADSHDSGMNHRKESKSHFLHPYDKMNWPNLRYEEGACAQRDSLNATQQCRTIEVEFKLKGPQVVPYSIAVPESIKVTVSDREAAGRLRHEDITYY